MMQKAMWLLVGIVGISSTGCGYSAGNLHREQIHTVCVQMFDSRDFRRDLEYRLTEAVTKRIEMDTPYRIASKDKADTLLTGELLEIRQNVLGKDFRTDAPLETGATFFVRYQWKDLRNGRILSERQQLVFTTTYIRSVGETFFEGSMRGFDGLAELLVETAMESDW